jgi:hypothetical protein
VGLPWAQPKIKLGRALTNAVTGTYSMSVVPQGAEMNEILERPERESKPGKSAGATFLKIGFVGF